MANAPHSNHLQSLRDLLAKLAAGRQEYDFQPPGVASNAASYANEPARLKRYAAQVVSARMILLLASSRMTTQALVQAYLLGVDAQAPLPLLLAARAQLEVFAVVADAVRAVQDNSGSHEKDFAKRVETVDKALISATYGTRSSVVKGQLPHLDVSRLRPLTQEDLETLTSRNVLTRLEKLAKHGNYPQCKEDYERLCEYVHPNWGMNMLHVVASPLNAKLLRLSMSSDDPFRRAVNASVEAMLRAGSGTIDAFEDLESPFGSPTVIYPRSR